MQVIELKKILGYSCVVDVLYMQVKRVFHESFKVHLNLFSDVNFKLVHFHH